MEVQLLVGERGSLASLLPFRATLSLVDDHEGRRIKKRLCRRSRLFRVAPLGRPTFRFRVSPSLLFDIAQKGRRRFPLSKGKPECESP